MPVISMLSAPAGGGRFTPLKPTLTYAGSGLSNMGKFTITNHDATYIYTATGGTVASNVLTVTASTGSATLTAKAPKGLTNSPSIVAYRQAAVLTTVPFTQYNNPCGDCVQTGPNENDWVWSCGCVGASADGGIYGPCICRGPGYSYYENYGPTYTWGGSDYTNGQGEWWRIV